MRVKRRRHGWRWLGVALATFVVVLISFNFTRGEKQLERVLVHPHAIDSPQFRREMGVLLGPGITAGNQVQALDNGREIFPAMLADIRKAQRSITFETYIYWSGDVGKQFSEALSERARAGVEVNVVIDWVGGMKMEESLVTSMRGAGVKLELYRPLKWYNLSRVNKRTHRKLLVVDGRIGYTGGVGIADHWEGNAEDPLHWRDMHFRVEGPVVAQMQAAFIDNWIKATGRVLKRCGTVAEPGEHVARRDQFLVPDPKREGITWRAFVRSLQAMGYAPLSRFGRYTVDVVDPSGERQYFGMFESAREANVMKAKMAGLFPGATITQGDELVSPRATMSTGPTPPHWKVRCAVAWPLRHWPWPRPEPPPAGEPSRQRRFTFHGIPPTEEERSFTT